MLIGHTFFNQMNCPLNWPMGPLTRLGTVGVPESVQPNQISPSFLENQFFVFLGAPKYFFEPPKPYLTSETSLLGGRDMVLELQMAK